MATPTPLGGTVQAPDIESNSIPPPRKFIFRRLRNPIRLETITSLASIAGLCMIAIAVPCFIVFSCVALGRAFVEGSGNNDPGKPRANPNGEYVISVLAGFFLLLLATGTLTFLALSCENSLEKTFVQWVMVILILFGFGPASVALSTRILQARIAHVVTGDIVVHYFAGCTTIGLSTFFLLSLLKSRLLLFKPTDISIYELNIYGMSPHCGPPCHRYVFDNPDRNGGERHHLPPLVSSNPHQGMTTPTPLAGTVQAQDVESIYHPPLVPRRKFQFHNPIRSGTVLYVASMGGTCILLVALSCFVFFSFVALGRVVIAYSGESPIQTPSGEYAVAVLAGFFFTLFAGCILSLYVNCGEGKFKDWFMKGMCTVISLLVLGTASVAVSSKILQSRIPNMVVGNVVLHYFVGCIILVVGPLVVFCFFFSWAVDR